MKKTGFGGHDQDGCLTINTRPCVYFAAFLAFVCVAPACFAASPRGKRDVRKVQGYPSPDGHPADRFPPYLKQVGGFGERLKWSHDGTRILIVEKPIKIAWAHRDKQRPTPGNHHARNFAADMVYESGKPKLASQRIVFDSRPIPFQLGDASWETQVFEGKRYRCLAFSVYQFEESES